MRVALAQMTSGRDVGANLETCRRLAEHAAARDAQWILYPENAPYLGHDWEKPDIAEFEDGPMIEAFREIARTHAMWVTVGSYPEKIDGSRKSYNTLLMIAPDGAVTATYRKIHLFDVEVEGGISFRESDGVEAGSEVVVTEVAAGGETFGVGLSVCYDLRFPELYRSLVDRGASVLLVPAAFTLQTGRDHWHALLRARAIENQCWVLAPGQFGHHFEKRWSYGHSVVYDPWGHLVADASDREQIVVADIDAKLVEDVRTRMPCLRHRQIH